MKKFVILSWCVGLMLGAILPAVRVAAEALDATETYVGEAGEELMLEDEAEEVVEEEEEVKVLDVSLAEEEDEDEDETVEGQSRIYIKAINPGYKVNGVSNAGEFVELARTGDLSTPISLAGMTVRYTIKSGEPPVTLVEFPENSWMTGESILLRLASSAGHELAAVNYTVKGASAGIAQGAGPLTLIQDGEVVDEVCWTAEEGCERKFKTGSGEVLLRDIETDEWSFVLGYIPEYDESSYLVEEVAEDNATVKVVAQCKGLQFSEVLSYYETVKSEQFIEFYNAGSGVVNLDGCMVRYKNKKYVLSGRVEPEGYFAYYPVGFSLTKNPTTSNKIELLDVDETVVDTLEYPNGQRKGTAYAWIGYDGAGQKLWKVTYAPTPGAPNNYQEFKTCEAGKVINKVTGNCVKVTSVSEKVCKEGYYLNVLTGRCKKNPTTTEKTCKEGYYLNPETNRCRKIQENNGANYSLEPENYEEESSFIALYAVLGVLGVGVLYLIWEFRGEIAKLWRKLRRKGGR